MPNRDFFKEVFGEDEEIWVDFRPNPDGTEGDDPNPDASTKPSRPNASPDGFETSGKTREEEEPLSPSTRSIDRRSVRTHTPTASMADRPSTTAPAATANSTEPDGTNEPSHSEAPPDGIESDGKSRNFHSHNENSGMNFDESESNMSYDSFDSDEAVRSPKTRTSKIVVLSERPRSEIRGIVMISDQRTRSITVSDRPCFEISGRSRYEVATGTLFYYGQTRDNLLSELKEIPSIEGLRSVVVDRSVACIPGSLFRVGADEHYSSFFFRRLWKISFATDAALTIIERSAFFNCQQLTSIKIPASVEIIGAQAFLGCKLLKRIEFAGDSPLESINSELFCGCSRLVSIQIPSSVHTIGHGAFRKCESLKQIEFAGDQLTSIGKECFCECSHLLSIKIPASVQTIEHRAFRFCSSLTQIEFAGDQLTSIGGECFYECSKLTLIQIPKLVQRVGEEAFCRCKSLEQIEFAGDQLTWIGRKCFGGLLHLSSITIPKSVQWIEKEAFCNCKSLEQVKFAGDTRLKRIGKECFFGCSKLTSIQIPKSVREIMDGTFWECKSLSTINIPKSVGQIGARAFQECRSLKTITFAPDSQLTNICTYAFAQCSKVESLELPASLRLIVENSFQDCKSLTSVGFAENTKFDYLPRTAFAGCKKLKVSSAPDAKGREWIGGDRTPCRISDPPKSFWYKGKQYRPSEEDIEIVIDHVRNIPFFEKIRHVIFDSSVTEIPACCFKDHDNLVKVEILGSVTRIGKSAFSGVRSLRIVKFHSVDNSKLTGIGDSTFEGCSNLVSIELPSSVSRIGQRAFWGCSKLAVVRFGGYSSKTLCIEDSAFMDCMALTEMRIQRSVLVLAPRNNHLYIEKRHNLPVHELLYSQTIPGGDGSTDAMLEKLDSLWKTNTEAFERIAPTSEMTPLHLYAMFPMNGNLEVFKRLVERTPDALVRKDKNGRCPIHWACVVGQSDHDILSVLSSNMKAFQGDGKQKTPLQLGIQALSVDAARLVYSFQPIPPSVVPYDIARLKQIKKAYKRWIQDGKFIQDGVFSPRQQHGWVEFIYSHLNEEEEAEEIASFIKDSARCNEKALKALAYARDRDRRVAIDLAPPKIKEAFESRWFFQKRYSIDKGPPIHKSATCVVVKAFDVKMDEYYQEKFKKYDLSPDGHLNERTFHKALQGMAIISEDTDQHDAKLYFNRADIDQSGKISQDEFIKFCTDEFGQTVALKFMRKKDQYHRELQVRKSFRELSKHVLPVVNNYDETQIDANSLDSFIGKHLTLESEKPEEYCYVLVMHHGDRNLDTIFRSERPDMNGIRKHTKEAAFALCELHSYGYVHGDFKMHNVVRVHNRLMLIDLDASAKMQTSINSDAEYIGAKFSSGVLPPEMIHCFDFDEREIYREYLEKYSTKQEQEKREPEYSDRENKWCAVRSFIQTTEVVSKKDNRDGKYKTVMKCRPMALETLPPNFHPQKADPSMDVWAFGILLYTMCVGRSLFTVNKDDDIEDGTKTGDELMQLKEWNKKQLEDKLQSVKSKSARKLLKKLLDPDPDKRPSMKEILTNSFFSQYDQDDYEDIIRETARQVGDEVREKVGEEVRKGTASIERKIGKVEGKVDNVGDKVQKETTEIKGKIGKVEGKVDNVGDKVQKEGTAIKGKVDNVGDKVQKETTEIKGKIDNVGDKVQKKTTEIKGKIDKVGEEIRTEIDPLKNMMKTIIDNSARPRYMLALPDEWSKLKRLDPSKMLYRSKLRIYFLCPITTTFPEIDGIPVSEGYKLEIPQDWLRKHGRMLVILLKVSKIVLSLTKGVFGVDPKVLKGIEEGIEEGMKFHSTKLVENIQEFGLEPLSQSEAFSAQDNKIPVGKYNEVIDTIGELIKDRTFEGSGLRLATCTRDGTSEYVGHDVVWLYEKFGKKCFNMKRVEIDRQVKLLNDEAQRKRTDEMNNFLRRINAPITHQGVLKMLKTKNGIPKWKEKYFVIYKDGKPDQNGKVYKVEYFKDKLSFHDPRETGNPVFAESWDPIPTDDAHIQVRRKGIAESLKLRVTCDTNKRQKRDEWVYHGNQAKIP